MRRVSITITALAWMSLACAHGPRPAVASTLAQPQPAPPPPRCPGLGVDVPLDDDDAGGRLHVQVPAALSCPAVLDPSGELIAACVGTGTGGVVVIELEHGREILHVPGVRAGAWGWADDGGLLVAREGERFVEVGRVGPRSVDVTPKQRATIEVVGSTRERVGLTRYGELAAWLRYPPPPPPWRSSSSWRVPNEVTNVMLWRELGSTKVHEQPLPDAVELLWSIDGRSFAYVVDGARAVIERESGERSASWGRGLLAGADALAMPMAGGRSGAGDPHREREPIVGLGRTRLIHQDDNGRLWLSSRNHEGAFVRTGPLDELPRHGWFEGFSPAEDAALFRVGPEPEGVDEGSTPNPHRARPRADTANELLIVDLETGARLASRTVADGFDSATLMDPRCGVVVVDEAGPRVWPRFEGDDASDDERAPLRRLGVARGPGRRAQTWTDSGQGRLDFDGCSATLERDGREPATLSWPDDRNGERPSWCHQFQLGLGGTRLLLMTDLARSSGILCGGGRICGNEPAGQLRASMFALDGKNPGKPLWTRDLPDEATIVRFRDGELLVASGMVRSTLVRMSIDRGKILGQKQLPEIAAIVALVEVPGADDSWLVLTNEPYTRWRERPISPAERSGGVLALMAGPERPEPFYLHMLDHMLDQDREVRWTRRVEIESWEPTDGWFPIYDPTGPGPLSLDASGRWLLFYDETTALGELEGDGGVRWHGRYPSLSFTADGGGLMRTTEAGIIETRALSPELELISQEVVYADGSWVRWSGNAILDHSPGEGYRAAVTHVGG